jgi:Cytochrome C oxidase, cbb3-type, subunit III
MRLGPRVLLGGILLTIAAAGPVAGAEEAPAFKERVAPFLAKYCNRCHGGQKPKAGLNLAAFHGEDAVAEDRKTWAKVYENLEAGSMPPEDQPQPNEAEVAPILRWINAELAKVDCRGLNDPGRVTLRR